MTKAYLQALAYGQEIRDRQKLDQEKNNFLDVRAPNRSMFRDFTLGEGIFSHGEEVKMHMRVATKIAEHAAAVFREQFAKEFNDHKANAVVEVPIPQKKNSMPHAWSSDPDRDTKVRMDEDGRTKPYRTLEESIRDAKTVITLSPFFESGRGEGVVFTVSAHEHLETVRKVQLAAWGERDRANEARARVRKRWRERGKPIAKLQARLSERKQNVANTSLRKWSEALEDRHATLAVEFRQAVIDGKHLRSLVNNYEDRVGELNMKVSRLEGDLDLAIQSHSNATERRL